MKHASIWISIGLAWSVFLGAAALGAAGPSDKGIQINYGAMPLTNPYNSQPSHATLAANATYSTVSGNDFASPLRLQAYTQSGGRYDGTAQTAYGLSFGVLTMRSQGQGAGYYGVAQGYGKGNAFFGDGGSFCWGGGETTLPSSTPECAALGEYEADQGAAVFEGTVSTPASPSMTTMHYAVTTHNEVIGSRAIFNYNHVHSSGAIASYTDCTDSSAGECSVTGGTCPLGAGSSCTVVTFSGSSLPVSTPGLWYFKSVGTDDDYAPTCNYDDVNVGGKCVGHWYKATPTDSTHLLLWGVFDAYNLDSNIAAATGPWYMQQGIEATAVDPVNHTITLPANGLNWASTERIYSPPSHYMAMHGVNLILRKEYKTGAETAPSYGARIVNFGPERADAGVFISGANSTTGGFLRGIQITNLNPRNTCPAGVTCKDTRAIDISGDPNVGLAIVGDMSASDDINTLKMGSSGQCVMGCGQASMGSAWEFDSRMVRIGQGIDTDGGGKKIGFVNDSGTLAASTRKDETVTWTTAFRGTQYSPACTVEDPAGYVQVVSVKTINAGSLIVTVQNTDLVSGHANFVVHCLAEYRGN
jgi:hypothetical protein